MLNSGTRALAALLNFLSTAVLLLLVVPTVAFAQTTPPQGPVRTTGTTVTVIAQKEPADPATLPVSVTAVPEDLLRSAGVTFISDAAMFSPNTHFTEFTARKLSNPRIRGVGASPANPGVMTYIDGVPQLNSNTSSLDFVGVDQVEFVRGPASALFGRNALGGVINIISTLPSMSKWGGEVSVPFGSYAAFDVRANASGPIIKDKLAAGFAGAFSQREGFTTNVFNNSDVDYRDGFSGKGQLLWTPAPNWDARVIVAGERARDGDYALNDLDAVRANPFEVSRDFNGHTDRDIFSTAIIANYRAPKFTITSNTGIVNWKTFDATDLDYSPMPLATRNNEETATQFTEEVRVVPVETFKINESMAVRWQAGGVIYTQGYDQFAQNFIAPFVLSPFVGFPVTQTSPQAELDDFGMSVYGQGTLAYKSKLDITVGARFDHERRDGNIVTSYDPAIAAPTLVDERRVFSDVSPQIAAAYKLDARTIVYGNFSGAFKAGGFNPVAIPGSEVFEEEHATSIEGGIKTNFKDGRFRLTAAAYSISWTDLQLNVPIPGAPGQFYIDNAGDATSRGVEFEITARICDDLDLFGGIGTTHARFDSGAFANGLDVAGNKIPNTPSFTTMFGAQYSHEIKPGHRLYGQLDIATTGAFQYDEANTQGQDAYTLTNLRAGFAFSRYFVEGFVRNMFDTQYVPLAFAYNFSPSGFIGEPGRPRTWGLNVGMKF